MKKLPRKIKLSVIVLNYNTADLLRQCLKSLPRRREYEVFVVDNASSDSSVAIVEKEFLWIKLIKSDKNLGFARGNNLAKKQVSGEYVLFLNPDTVVEPGAIETIVSFMDSDSAIGTATCLVVLPNGQLYYACHRGFPTPWNAFCYFSGLSRLFPKVKIFSGYTLSYESSNTVHEIDACSGTFLMIRKNLLDKLNWFDEDYFWYGEDIDLCFRVKSLGYKVVFNPLVKIIHYWGAASGLKETTESLTTATAETKVRSTIARFEVMKIFYNKHYAQKYPFLVRWLVFAAIDLKKFISLHLL